MARLREFFQKNPAAGYALGVGLLIIAGYLLWGQLLGGPQAPAPAEQPPAPPAAAPPTGPAAPPAAAPVQPVSSISAKVVPPGPAGRADPFIPLVTAPLAAGTPPAQPAGPPLPPPPFPAPGAQLPPPPLPAPPGAPVPGAPGAPAPSPSAGISVTGIVGDARKVVIVAVGGKTEILFEGQSVGDLRVIKIDPARGIVTFERAGKRFDVSLGGG